MLSRFSFCFGVALLLVCLVELYSYHLIKQATLSGIKRKGKSAAICSIVRDEKKYPEEWSLYHLALGFERIYIYDNSVNASAKTWLHEEQENNTILKQGVGVHHYPTQRKTCQIDAYKSCIKTYGANHTWVALIDPDEFLVLKIHDSVVDLLSHSCRNGSLSINWMIFGTSNQTEYVHAPVTQRFQYHTGVDTTVKTIVKVLDYMGQRSPHWVFLRNDSMRHDTDGEWIRGARMAGVNNPTFHENGPTNVAAIHHYKYKSLEEFNEKLCARGDVWNQNICVNHTLANLPAGYIWDDSAWQFLQRLVPQYRGNIRHMF